MPDSPPKSTPSTKKNLLIQENLGVLRTTGYLARSLRNR
jgi:hypothetical protein